MFIAASNTASVNSTPLLQNSQHKNQTTQTDILKGLQSVRSEYRPLTHQAQYKSALILVRDNMNCILELSHSNQPAKGKIPQYINCGNKMREAVGIIKECDVSKASPSAPTKTHVKLTIGEARKFQKIMAELVDRDLPQKINKQLSNSANKELREKVLNNFFTAQSFPAKYR